MGSFGKTDFREMSPDYATHTPELANGFVWENGHWLRFVRGAGPLLTAGKECQLRLGTGGRGSRRVEAANDSAGASSSQEGHVC
jgi:hypothetical protein